LPSELVLKLARTMQKKKSRGVSNGTLLDTWLTDCGTATRADSTEKNTAQEKRGNEGKQTWSAAERSPKRKNVNASAEKRSEKTEHAESNGPKHGDRKTQI